MAKLEQTISDFYRVAQERDFARDFQFRVLSINPGGSSAVTFSEDDLVYIKGGQIPTRTIVSHEVPYMGLQFRLPGAAQYSGEFTAGFYCDVNSRVRQLMEEWSFQTFDDSTSQGDYFMPRESSYVELVQLDSQFETTAIYKLIGCFPTEVGDIQYDIGGSGNAVEFNVNLSYHFWRRTG
tara:strand:- start:2187 stop:2726 length:540 start_codon:yes stop_codon:yes gene_type:complete